jgi:hypothetical protein
VTRNRARDILRDASSHVPSVIALHKAEQFFASALRPRDKEHRVVLGVAIPFLKHF